MVDSLIEQLTRRIPNDSEVISSIPIGRVAVVRGGLHNASLQSRSSKELLESGQVFELVEVVIAQGVVSIG